MTELTAFTEQLIVNLNAENFACDVETSDRFRELTTDIEITTEQITDKTTPPRPSSAEATAITNLANATDSLSQSLPKLERLCTAQNQKEQLAKIRFAQAGLSRSIAEIVKLWSDI